MSRRKRVALLIIVSQLVLAVLAYFVTREVLFPPRFDVISIASLPAYKDKVLLARAFRLPVAATFGGRLDYQENGSLCGPASLANIERSLGRADASARAVLVGSGLCWSGVCLGGLTLDQVGELVRRQGRRRVSVLRDLSPEQFREHVARSNDPARRYLINFQRGLLFGKGAGHHSPLGGYLADRDLVLVLDVNREFGPWLVPTERLYQAMNTVDPSSGRKRGLLLITSE